jgi:hypothetical protein
MTLAAWTNHGWTPGPGDPSWVAWVSVAVYLAGAWLSWKAAVKEADDREKRGVSRLPWVWLVAGAFLLLLALNKQLDLHNAITHFGRLWAREEGWYRERRSVQLAFTAFGGLVGFALFAMGWWRLVRPHPRYFQAVAGCSVLLGFVLMRMASFHHLDQWLKQEFFAGRLHSWLELTGGFWVAFAALRATQKPKSPR